MDSIQIRPKTAADVEWATNFLKQQSIYAHTPLDRDEINDILNLPAFIAEVDGEPMGLIVYQYQNDICHIVSLHVSRKRMGVGEALLKHLESEASRRACKKLQCIVTNDNLNALRFLQKRAFHLTEVRAGAIEARREQNPTIHLTGEYGIPLRDELLLEKDLTKTT
ncbi:MAG: GNAT family N-acetyltransferase [Chloroherpetonaceae bacterium]